MKRISAFLAAALLVLALPAGAGAEGFSVIDWSARGVALAGGLVARADDASAVAYNPAGMTQLPGVRMMLGTTVVSPLAKVDALNGGQWSTTGINREHWLMPHFYTTYQINDKFWAGVGIFSRFGLGNGFPGTWAGSDALADVSLQTITLNPNIAWKVNDKLSVAAGVEISGAMMEMNKNYNLGALGYNNQNLDGTGAALSGNLALRYAFNDEWAVGLTYRSRMRVNVHGKVRWGSEFGKIPALVALNPALAIMQNSELHGTLSLPDTLSAAVMWKPSPRLSLEAGLAYAAWSNYRHLDIYLEDPVNAISYGSKHWRDVWTLNGSVEFQALDWLALRGGFGYETSPNNKANADYMVPTNGRWYVTAGVGFTWNKWSLDLGYSYLRMKDLSFDGAFAAHGPGLGNVRPGRQHSAYANIVSLSLGYSF